MLWNSLMCSNYLNLKSLFCDLKLDSWTFDFIKNSTQIINIFSKVQPKKKVNLCWNGESITYFPYKVLNITSFNHPKVKIKVRHMPLNKYCSLVLQIMYVVFEILEKLIVIFIEFPMTRNTQNLVVPH
jgi:hypothetical protein